MIQVFLLGGELVRPMVAHNLMQLIAEGYSRSLPFRFVWLGSKLI